MTALICVRVSPRPAENVRYSPEIQESACRRWCEDRGIEVAGVVQDILVSGGAENRFDAILRALDADPSIDTCVVSDLSRWTRDTPQRYWAFMEVLTKRKVVVQSAEQSFVGSDMPFSATITTAVVEANAMERATLRRKTSAGVRAAWAKGKRWGNCFGWTWNPDTRSYDIDVDKINGVYDDWITGKSIVEIGNKYGLWPNNVPKAISAKRQVEVVGEAKWNAAQYQRGGRAVRHDVKSPNLYRRLLVCPFCGHTMVIRSDSPGAYYCQGRAVTPHPWGQLSARRYITPAVQQTLNTLMVPDSEFVVARPRAIIRVQRDVQAEKDRLAEAWVRGRISQDRYDKLLTELEGVREEPPPPPLPKQIEMLRSLSVVNLQTKDPAEAAIINRLLREVFERIDLTPERAATPIVSATYQHWIDVFDEAVTG